MRPKKENNIHVK